jgi:uncharacterized delta-60 repeat protein
VAICTAAVVLILSWRGVFAASAVSWWPNYTTLALTPDPFPNPPKQLALVNVTTIPSAFRDGSFPLCPYAGGTILGMKVHPNGDLFLNGRMYFTNLGNRSLVRVTPDGKFDTSLEFSESGIGPIDIAPNGAILFVSGPSVGRWMPNNQGIDPPEQFRSPSFDPNSEIRGIKVADHGKIYLTGVLRTGGTYYRSVRLNPDGSWDKTWNNSDYIGRVLRADASGMVYAEDLEGTLLRLKQNGERDAEFNPPTFERCIYTGGTGAGGGGDCRGAAIISRIALDSKGRIVVGGDIRWVNRQPIAGLVRVNTDGSLDTLFRWEKWQSTTTIDDFLLLDDETFVVTGQGGKDEYAQILALGAGQKIYLADPYRLSDFSTQVTRYYLPLSLRSSFQGSTPRLEVNYGNSTNVVVQSSSSLRAWDTMASITNYSGQWSAAIPLSETERFRFFRAFEGP